MGAKQGRKEIVYTFYNHFAKAYDESRYSSEEQKITDSITKQVVLELVGDTKNKLILDCGCGTGRFVEFFTRKSSRVIGVDISENMLKLAKAKIPNANLSRVDIFFLPFKANTFDVIICSQVLTHLHNYKEPLLQMRRVLKDDGAIIIDIRNILFPYALFDTLKRAIRKSSEEYYPNYVSILRMGKICNGIGLRIDEFRGAGLSIKVRGIERMKKEIKRSKSKLRYVAPTLLLKIVKKER